VTVQSQARPVYAGLVTRTIAIAIDFGIANLLAALTAAILGAILSVIGLSGKIDVAGVLAAGAGWIAWVTLYFVAFWTLTGQTPGDRLIGIRVVSTSGGAIKFRHAVLRFFAMVLCAIPLGAGFLPVLFDDRRRGYHDRAAGTVVRWVQREDELRPVESEPAIRTSAVETPVTDALPSPVTDPATARNP
jgi:uncharacterized RDD family membrane protein YckC